MSLPSDAVADSVRSRLRAAAGRARHRIWSCEWFPGRHGDAYGEDFFRKAMVTAVQVAADLADPRGGPASCTAEEIVRHAVGAIAGELCEAAGLGKPWLDPDEYLLEDADFEFLYGEDMDGLENDPGMRAALNIDVSPVQDWFSPFNSSPGSSTPKPRRHRAHRSCLTCIRGSGQTTILRSSWLPTSWTRRRR